MDREIKWKKFKINEKQHHKHVEDFQTSSDYSADDGVDSTAYRFSELSILPRILYVHKLSLRRLELSKRNDVQNQDFPRG